LKARNLELGEEDDRTIVDLLIEQVEFANVIVLNKTDLVKEGELNKLRAIINRFNPAALVVESGFAESRSIKS
jgi:G3E family GTPase